MCKVIHCLADVLMQHNILFRMRSFALVKSEIVVMHSNSVYIKYMQLVEDMICTCRLSCFLITMYDDGLADVACHSFT